MIDKINELVNKINECEYELTNIEKEVVAIDIERLNKCAQVAIRGLKLDKIYSKLTIYNNCDNYIEDEYIYYKDKNDKYLKGKCVATKQLSYSRDYYRTSESCRELFIMDDGTFKVFYHTSRIVDHSDEKSTYERKLSNFQDITQFNFDGILENIIDGLNMRLISLGKRSKSQLERLEKLKKAEIS